MQDEDAVEHLDEGGPGEGEDREGGGELGHVADEDEGDVEEGEDVDVANPVEMDLKGLVEEM